MPPRRMHLPVSLVSLVRQMLATAGPGPIALVAKYDTWGFATDLAGLDLTGFRSLLAVPEANAAALTPEQRRRFDLVLPLPSAFDATDPSLLGGLARVQLPELEALLGVLLEQRRADALHLVGLEEELLRPLAALRERFGLPGQRPAELARFVDKDVMKACFEAHGVEVPRSAVIHGVPDEATAALQADLLARLELPLFVKPCDGVAGGGSARLERPGELSRWLQDHRGSAQAYVVEEFVAGSELFAYCLARGGALDVLSIDAMHLPMFEAVATDEPVAELSLPRGSAEHAEIRRFVQRVFAAVAPVPDGCFVVQVMRARSDGRLRAIEVSVRVPGDVAPRTIAWATGLNVEVLHLTAQLPGARATPIPDQQRRVATLLFRKRPGVVAACREPPPPSPGNRQAVTWLASPGDPLRAARTYDDLACIVQLAGDDDEAVARDYARLLGYRPLQLVGEEP